MTTPQSDIKLGPDLGDVEGNAEGWGWVVRGEMLQRTRRASSTAFAQLRWLVAKFSSVSFCSHSDSLPYHLSLLFLVEFSQPKSGEFSVFHDQNQTIFTARMYRFGL